MYCTDNVTMMKKFYNGLSFINEQLYAYCEKFFPNTIWPKYPLNRFFRTQVKDSQASTLKQYQSDCRVQIADLIGFSKTAEEVLASCRDPVKLNMYIHFAYAVEAYFSHIKQKTPAFWDQQPQNVPKVPIPKNLPPWHLP